MYGVTYADMARFEANHFKNDFDREVGCHVICEVKEVGATRLFIKLFSNPMNVERKEGWWNTFTVCNKPMNRAGHWICKIEKYVIDRNGFLKCIVKPKKYIGEVVDFENRAWIYFSYAFSTKYNFSELYRRRNNTSYLEKTVLSDQELEQCCSSTQRNAYKELIFSKYMDGRITIEEIDNLLDKRTDLEELAERLGRRPKLYEQEYPLTVARITRELGTNFYTISDIKDFLNDKYLEYEKLSLGDSSGYLERTEAVALHWKRQREFEKAERKARRKAKKLH